MAGMIILPVVQDSVAYIFWSVEFIEILKVVVESPLRLHWPQVASLAQDISTDCILRSVSIVHEGDFF